jgi:hypothetical protein
VRREGPDVTIIATSIQVPRALAAAEALAREGISADVVDPRALQPLDKDRPLASIQKTGRVVLTDESHDNLLYRLKTSRPSESRMPRGRRSEERLKRLERRKREERYALLFR